MERGGTVEERVRVNPNPPKLKFDKDRVHIFQTNVQLSEKLEPLKTLINKPELHKPDIDHCVLNLNDLIVDSANKTCPVDTRRKTKKKEKKGKKCWFDGRCGAETFEGAVSEPRQTSLR